MRSFKRFLGFSLAVIMVLSLCGCNVIINDARSKGNAGDAATGEAADNAITGEAAEDTAGEAAEESTVADEVEKNGDVIILFTSDIHCGIDQGFGLAGLEQVRETYESEGYTVLLVDDGDAIQGEAVGTISKGESIIQLMNDMKYDVAIPGNHEFDYGMDRFLELTKMADFPYICCNFRHDGELVFDPYIIKEAAGMRIAFVGVTTPVTITTSTPRHFQDENGKFVYDFCQDDTGQGVYDTVQKAVDDARAEGVDYVYIMGHMGLDDACAPWTYADVIANTNGIDVFLDGHSHDTEQIVMKNKDGEDVVRSACGTKLDCIGYSRISKDNGIEETNILNWPNKVSAPDVLGIDNDMRTMVNDIKESFNEELNEVIAASDVFLTINDPEKKDESGNPIRMIRRGETNLGDFCADVFRNTFDSDIAVINGGGIRTNINKGDITYGNIIDVFPFNNQTCVIEVTGQQVLDALEWGARVNPEETGAFLHVSGMSYEIDLSVESGCKTDANNMCAGIVGERRVKNVKVGDEPIDPEKTYTLAGISYTLLNHGDGYTAFDGANVIENGDKLDNQVLIDYITDTLGGRIGEEYADPYGQGRITIIDETEKSEGEN